MPKIFLDNYLRDLSKIFNDISRDEFDVFIMELLGANERSSQIFIFGNGGSAANASHFACDVNKGVRCRNNKRYKVICLNDNMPTILAYANDLSYNDIYAEQLKYLMQKDDLIIGVSGSGNSENVLKAIAYGNANGGSTFGICGFGGGKLREIAQKSLVIKSNDMQKVEDFHMIIFHCAMQYLNSIP